MSLDIRYLSNGKKTLYCISNTGVKPTEYTTYEKLEDIPESIRHYAPAGMPEFVDPDIAQVLGFGPDLYPELEDKCGYNGYQFTACIGPGCHFVGEGALTGCQYWERLRKAGQ